MATRRELCYQAQTSRMKRVASFENDARQYQPNCRVTVHEVKAWLLVTELAVMSANVPATAWEQW